MNRDERTYYPVSGKISISQTTTRQPETELVDPQILDMFRQELASKDQARRQRAATRMSEIKESWVMQLALDYLEHPDPTVSDCAKKAIENFSPARPQLKKQLSQNEPVAAVETYTIRNNLQLVDEVIFVLQRNLFNIAFANIKVSLPKLFFIFLLYLSAAGILPTPAKMAAETAATCILVLLHQVFWRPIIWQGLAPVIMAGFPDKATRALSRQTNTPDYKKTLGNGLIESLCFSALFCLAFINYESTQDLSGLLFFGSLLWLATYAEVLTIIPFSFLSPTEQSVFSGDSFKLGSYGRTFWFSLKFSFIIAVIYVVIISSIGSVAHAFGVDTWAGLNRLNPRSVMLCLIVTADCFIDPFIIAYRLLFTRLLMGKQS